MTTRWRKSSRSGAGPTNCVEVAHTQDAVRDSKNPAGPTLAVDLTGLLDSLRAGRLAR